MATRVGKTASTKRARKPSHAVVRKPPDPRPRRTSPAPIPAPRAGTRAQGASPAPIPAPRAGEPPQGTPAPTEALLAPTPPAPAPLGTLLEIVPDSSRAVEIYLRAQLSPRTRENALDALRRLTRLLTGGATADPTVVPWAAIEYEQATAIRTALYESTRTGAITPGTANLTLSHLRGLIRALYGLKLVTSDQHELTHSGALKSVPGKRTPRGRALTPLEERELRRAARRLKGYRGTMLDTAIVLAIGAGLRREEATGLTLEGFGADALEVLGKGNKSRRIPVDAQMHERAEIWLEKRTRLELPHGGLFCSPRQPERTLSPWSFWSLVRTASHAAFGTDEKCAEGCPCLDVVTGPHDFRRTFATRLLDQGFDIRQVQVLMGHESPETTARYDKRDINELFEKRRKAKVIA